LWPYSEFRTSVLIVSVPIVRNVFMPTISNFLWQHFLHYNQFLLSVPEEIVSSMTRLSRLCTFYLQYQL
jgi:hypothetical protein